MTMKTETNKRTFKGKPAIEKLLKFEEHIKKKSIVTQPETRLRASLLPKNGKSVSPIECFQSLVDKHDNKSVQNIYFMCLSFILQSEDEINVSGNSICQVLTNYVFKEKKRKKETKNKYKNHDEELFQNLTSDMKFFISSEFASGSFIQLQPTQGLLTDILDKKLYLNVVNYSNEDFILPPNTALGKIYFYF